MSKSDHIKRSSLHRAAVAAVLMLFAFGQARAASIAVGNHFVLPNTPNQVITIQVTGGEQIAGEDFYAQIGDGGAFVGGTNTKPSFTNVNILDGTVFGGNNVGASGDPNGSPLGSNAGHPLIWLDGTVTASGTVAASGLLATFTVDTTGLNSGTFPLLLTGVAPTLGPFNTTLRSATGDAIPLSVTNGMLMVSALPPADYNHNGLVDAADYVIWRGTLGQTGAGLAADGDHDNAVTQADYDLWKTDFGYLSPGSGAAAKTAATAVPEPATSSLLLVAILLIVCRSSMDQCGPGAKPPVINRPCRLQLGRADGL